MREQDTKRFLSEFANEFLFEYGGRDLSVEQLEDLMEREALLEEADDMSLPDYKMGDTYAENRLRD